MKFRTPQCYFLCEASSTSLRGHLKFNPLRITRQPVQSKKLTVIPSQSPALGIYTQLPPPGHRLWKTTPMPARAAGTPGAGSSGGGGTCRWHAPEWAGLTVYGEWTDDICCRSCRNSLIYIY